MDGSRILKMAQAAPVLVWGPPGIGKSAGIEFAARKAGLHIEVIIASIREPSDFAGLPVVGDGGVSFAPPAWAQRIVRAGGGVVFIDEITTCPPAVQHALLRVLTERVVGDIALPPETRFIAAANPADQAVGYDLTPPLANRFIHVEWELRPSAWVREFPSYWGHPPALPGIPGGEWAKARALVAAFISRRPELLLRMPEDPEAGGRAWPSPRSWDFASRLLALGEREAFAGAVGSGAAGEFVSWLERVDLPDPLQVLGTADTFPIPAEDDVAFAIASSVAEAVAGMVGEGDTSRWEAAWVFLGRYSRGGRADVALPAAQRLARLRKVHGLPVTSVVRQGLKGFMPLLREVR